MTEARIAELRALAEKASAGPWTHHEGDECQYLMAARTSQTLAWVEDRSQDSHPTQYRDDAAFIAAARTALPEALDAIDGLQYTADQRLADMQTAERKLDVAQDAIERVRALCTIPMMVSHDDILAALDGKSA